MTVFLPFAVLWAVPAALFAFCASWYAFNASSSACDAFSSALFIVLPTWLASLSQSIAPFVICFPLIVPTVKLAQLRFTTSISDASILPAVNLLAVNVTIFASVIEPSAICADSITPSPIIAFVMHPSLIFAKCASNASVSMLPASILSIRALITSKSSICATSIIALSMLAIFVSKIPISALVAYNCSTSAFEI